VAGRIIAFITGGPELENFDEEGKAQQFPRPLPPLAAAGVLSRLVLVLVLMEGSVLFWGPCWKPLLF